MSSSADVVTYTPPIRIQITADDYPSAGLTATLRVAPFGPAGTVAARALAWMGANGATAYVAFASAPQSVPVAADADKREADGMTFYPVEFLTPGHEKAMQIVALHEDSAGPWELVF
jgi:hypothetical protein